MLNKMLFTIPKDKHDAEAVKALLSEHPEIRFVSLAAADIFGNDTDEKIPIRIMLKDVDKFLEEGQQTDGSSVLLPKIADISDAKVDLIPDRDVNWYVDYNFGHIDDEIRTFYTIVRQYTDHDIVVNVYDSLDRAFGVYKCLVDVDTLTLPVPEQETHTA